MIAEAARTRMRALLSICVRSIRRQHSQAERALREKVGRQRENLAQDREWRISIFQKPVNSFEHDAAHQRMFPKECFGFYSCPAFKPNSLERSVFFRCASKEVHFSMGVSGLEVESRFLHQIQVVFSGFLIFDWTILHTGDLFRNDLFVFRAFCLNEFDARAWQL